MLLRHVGDGLRLQGLPVQWQLPGILVHWPSFSSVYERHHIAVTDCRSQCRSAQEVWNKRCYSIVNLLVFRLPDTYPSSLWTGGYVVNSCCPVYSIRGQTFIPHCLSGGVNLADKAWAPWGRKPRHGMSGELRLTLKAPHICLSVSSDLGKTCNNVCWVS